MDIIELALHLIEEDTDQPRYQFGEDSLQELMKSIEEIGLLSPIKVRTIENGKYKIIYGNRRYKASKLLGRPTIPCIISNLTDEVDIYLEQIAENLTREGFSPIEEAMAFDKMLNHPKFSSSIKFLSSKLSKPESYIKNKIDLLKFSNSVKKLIVSGTDIRKDLLTEEQLLPIKDLLPEHRDSLALIIARDELPVSDVKKIAQLFKDKDISSNTKDKLLYKTGPQLLETWSVFRHNKAEREKAAKRKEEEKLERLADAEDESVEISRERTNIETAAASSERVEDPQPTVSPPATALSPNPTSASKLTEVEQHVAQLVQSLPELLPLTHELEAAAKTLSVDQREQIVNHVNKLTSLLQAHLAVWQSFEAAIVMNEETQDS